MRIAESVLLTCWPPAPEARKRVDAQVGRVDVDAVDLVLFRQHRDGQLKPMWMRPVPRFSGTRCTRCVPDFGT